ncbi:MAG: hypothetical protein ACYCTH_07455 [Cellulomonas sp.]
MSTTALATVVAKFAGLNIAGKAVVGLAVAAGAVGAAAGVPVIANHVTAPPATGQVAVTQPVATRTGSPTVTQDPTDSATDAARMAAGSGPTGLPTAAMFGQQTAADAMAGGVDGRSISAQVQANAQAMSAQAQANAQAAHVAVSVPLAPAAAMSGQRRSTAPTATTARTMGSGMAAGRP